MQALAMLLLLLLCLGPALLGVLLLLLLLPERACASAMGHLQDGATIKQCVIYTSGGDTRDAQTAGELLQQLLRHTAFHRCILTSYLTATKQRICGRALVKHYIFA
jgi:uncharacterized SAM-binding protein YcdF (DUF218 family)